MFPKDNSCCRFKNQNWTTNSPARCLASLIFQACYFHCKFFSSRYFLKMFLVAGIGDETGRWAAPLSVWVLRRARCGLPLGPSHPSPNHDAQHFLYRWAFCLSLLVWFFIICISISLLLYRWACSSWFICLFCSNLYCGFVVFNIPGFVSSFSKSWCPASMCCLS